MRSNTSLFGRLIISSLAVFVAGWILPGIQIDSFMTAIVVAVILGFLNATLKPFLIIVTIPITVVTLGIFLLLINIFVIQVADYWIDGFAVRSAWTALLFSLLVSTISGWMYRANS